MHLSQELDRDCHDTNTYKFSIKSSGFDPNTYPLILKLKTTKICQHSDNQSHEHSSRGNSQHVMYTKWISDNTRAQYNCNVMNQTLQSQSCETITCFIYLQTSSTNSTYFRIYPCSIASSVPFELAAESPVTRFTTGSSSPSLANDQRLQHTRVHIMKNHTETIWMILRPAASCLELPRSSTIHTPHPIEWMGLE
jgi:hypothetical protein